MGGGISSFQGRYSRKCPRFFGGVLRIPKYIVVPDKGLQANDLARLTNIGNISKLRVTDLIPDALSCGGVLLLWSALSCGVFCNQLWSVLLSLNY